jgi:hypothetical protein
MSDEVYQALAQASCGFVESPAGCGKTEAIIRTVGKYCDGRQLVLTHTHAGVDALRQRFRQHSVPAIKYHVDTIAAWSWGWVRRYPENASYTGSTRIAQWNDVYTAMSALLQKDFVKRGVTNSYTGIIVDEYQDCTVPMHQMILHLKALLPCRVLGDDLQGIFDFRGAPLIDWSVARSQFANKLGVLETPHRWLKSGNNAALGRWLLSIRRALRQKVEPDYGRAPIDRHRVAYADLGRHLIRLTYEKRGKTCVIGPKARPLPAAIETILVKHNYRVLEPNELSALQALILSLTDRSPSRKSEAACNFLFRSHGGLAGNDKTFIKKILSGERQRPRQHNKCILCERHTKGTTPELVLDLVKYLEEIDGAFCKLRESVSALKCIVEEHRETDTDLKTLYANEIGKRKYQSRSNVYRCVGSTLLVKGLEFDHVIILRDQDWLRNWGNHKDLYVALTRGCKTTTLVELEKKGGEAREK